MTNEQVTTKEQSEKPKRTKEGNPSKRVKLRLLPIWLRLILVVLLVVIAAAVGLMIGYSVIGNGSAVDVLKWETWQQILDIMNGVEE